MAKLSAVSISTKAENLEEELGDIDEVVNELPDVMPLVGMYFISRVVPVGTKAVNRVVVGNITKALHDGCFLLRNLVAFGHGKGSMWLSVIHIMELQKGFRLYSEREYWVEEVGKSSKY